MLVIIAAVGLALLGLLIWCFVCESRDERHKIVVALVVTLLIEAILAGPASDAPFGLLRPRIGGQDFRPPDALIVAALVARILAIRSQQVGRLAALWAAFLALYVTGVIAGLLHGLNLVEVLFQGKGAFYLAGGMVIASGADLKRVGDSLARLAVVLVPLVPFALFAETVNLNLSFSTPVQRFNRLGRLSNDTVTLLTLVGVMVLLAEVTRPRRRIRFVAAGGILLLTPAAGQQRASYLVLACVVFGLLVLFAGKTWKRRSSLTGTEMGLLFTALIGLVMAGFLFTASPGVITAPITDAFGGEAESRSAQARISLIDQAVDKIRQNPVIGSGVGTKVIREAELGRRGVEAAAHNVLLDITMRVGLVGLTLFLVALFATFGSGISVWQHARDNRVAGVAAGASLVVLGVVAKAMVEPALDKFRLSLAMGIGIGLVMAAVRAVASEVPTDSAAVPGALEPA